LTVFHSLGILRELQAKLQGDQLLGPELVGLVLGAGGAGRAAGEFLFSYTVFFSLTYQLLLPQSTPYTRRE
jgi:hypothetical protein